MRTLDFADGFTSASSPTVGSPTTQTIANAQAATNITNLSVDHLVYRSAIIELEYSRKTASSERRGVKKITCVWDTTAGAWVVIDAESNNDVDSGITITFSGDNVQYATDSQAGATYVGTAKWQFLRRYAA